MYSSCLPLRPSDPVNVMDSLGVQMPLTTSAILQIASLITCQKSSFIIQKLAVQQQEGTNDCGLFAVAFALESCLKIDVSTVQFDQKLMRSHLYTCLQNGRLTAFPKINSPDSLLFRSCHNLIKISVYCTCRLPDVYDTNMIMCDTCRKWYHYKCMSLPSDIETINSSWNCINCDN